MRYVILVSLVLIFTSSCAYPARYRNVNFSDIGDRSWLRPVANPGNSWSQPVSEQKPRFRRSPASTGCYLKYDDLSTEPRYIEVCE